MKRSRSFRRLRLAAGIAAALAGIAAALALAAVVVGLQRASVAQAEAEISLDAAVSFPVDI